MSSLLLDRNLQALLAIVSPVISTEYMQLIMIEMTNKLFHKQAVPSSPKNQNCHLAPRLTIRPLQKEIFFILDLWF